MSLKNLTKNLEKRYPDYSNPEVLEILKNMGPYEYGSFTDDGSKRVKKPMQLLENKTKYEG